MSKLFDVYTNVENLSLQQHQKVEPTHIRREIIKKNCLALLKLNKNLKQIGNER